MADDTRAGGLAVAVVGGLSGAALFSFTAAGVAPRDGGRIGVFGLRCGESGYVL